MGILYIVSTPIGNLEDITLRAIRILKEVDLILAEDTRVTKKLLNHYEIDTKVTSYHKFTDNVKIDSFIEILKSDQNISLVSDAGTPLISDPGDNLIKQVINENIRMEVIPGASACISSLVMCGFDLRAFTFYGFLPKKTGELKKFFIDNVNLPHPFCFYESPNRLVDTLKVVDEIIPDRLVCVSRELTKMFEENIRGTAKELIEYFSQKQVKGEIVVVVDKAIIKEVEISDEYIKEMLEEFIQSGNSKKDAIKLCMGKTKLPKNRVYNLAMQLE